MQRSVEILIGRLATDEGLRARFFQDPARLVQEFAQEHALSAVEQAALRGLSREALLAFAGALDPRIKRASLAEHSDPRRI
jgi:hypothetical protein